MGDLHVVDLTSPCSFLSISIALVNREARSHNAEQQIAQLAVPCLSLFLATSEDTKCDISHGTICTHTYKI